MSNFSWQEQLVQALRQNPRANSLQHRIALVGIGNEFNGDDAAGVYVIRKLKSITHHSNGVLLIEAGQAPENFTGPLRKFNPDLVVVVDAANLDEAPGTIKVVDWQNTTGFGASTHTLPPSTFIKFLVEDIGCQVFFIGIQVNQIEYLSPMSLEVERAVEEIYDLLAEMLS